MSIARGLVGWWRLDGRLVDESGNGNDGTVGAGSAAYAAGKFGQAMDQTTAWRADVAGITSASYEAVTMAFWFKNDGLPSIINVFGVNVGNRKGTVTAFPITGGVRLEFRQGESNLLTETFTTEVFGGDWTHYAVTRSAATAGATIKVYVNRINVLTATTAYLASFTGAGFVIGNAQRFHMDNATIDNYARTPESIRQLYALGSPIGIV